MSTENVLILAQAPAAPILNVVLSTTLHRARVAMVSPATHLPIAGQSKLSVRLYPISPIQGNSKATTFNVCDNSQRVNYEKGGTFLLIDIPTLI